MQSHTVYTQHLDRAPQVKCLANWITPAGLCHPVWSCSIINLKPCGLLWKMVNMSVFKSHEEHPSFIPFSHTFANRMVGTWLVYIRRLQAAVLLLTMCYQHSMHCYATLTFFTIFSSWRASISLTELNLTVKSSVVIWRAAFSLFSFYTMDNNRKYI